MDNATRWLFDNREDATAAKDWADFCQRFGRIGGHYKAYAWLEKHFETLRAHPNTFTYRPLELPHARKASDLFTSAYLCPHIVRGKGQGSYTDAPPGTHFVGGVQSAFTVSRSMGGRRAYRIATDGEKIRTHYGATFFLTYAAPTAALRDAGRHDSFEAVDREDGVLILGHYRDYPGSTWIALLDKGETLESLFDEETRKRLADDREAERVAFGA